MPAMIVRHPVVFRFVPSLQCGEVARLFLVAALGMCVVSCDSTEQSPRDALRQARSALTRGEFDRAEQLAGRVTTLDEEWAAAKLIAGEAASKAGRSSDALTHYRELTRCPLTDQAVLGWFYSGEVYRELGQLTKAETAYRAVLARDPRNAATHERLAFLASVTGRSWEALPHYWFLAKSGTADVNELVLLADLDRPLENRKFIEACSQRSPQDHLVQLGLAAHDFWEGDARGAERRLREVLATNPDLFSGQAMLGELLIDRGADQFLKWHQTLPDGAAEHPDFWYIRGLWARRQGELPVAARCFWQAIRLAPTHRRAMYQLGQVLKSLGERSGDAVARRADLLIQLTQTLDQVMRTQSRREHPFQQTTELLEQTGRIWEACAWALAARKQFPESEWPSEVFSRLSEKLNDDLPLTISADDLALHLDLSAFPDHRKLFAARTAQPDEGESSHARAARRKSDHPAASSIRFVDQAQEAGIDFVYHNGPDPSTKGVRMFEQTGGGVAVLDFDEDGRPDLYFTQGAEWHHGAPTPTPRDQYRDGLYRNLGSRFDDVTRDTGLGDRDFSQGCSVGDFDNDGFPDLYVANIGRNRLYRNNGDGTFSDVTAGVGIEGDAWTTSCVVVDLNADGFPDLFDVTYVTGPQVYELICKDRGCSPSVFAGVPDRLLISHGDGTFESAPLDANNNNSKGLGIVAADLGTRGRPSLFIANDQVANFLMRNFPSGDRFHVALRDDALLCGLAFNEDGLAMAGMGIAADDADGDGRLDFFLSTFKDESGTLYLQDAPGLFVDATKPSGLHAPTWPYVGWGTQFLDADLDGEPDLVVANGHVDDYRDAGGEYHMRPQFFRNTGGGRFVELLPDIVGDFFGRKFLGRGLARLDWNGDGRMDFAVSHIGERASLVTNQSTGCGHFLNVRLHATTTARDAIGTVVEAATDRRRWTKQLVAGDGYMASNERRLQFGLGGADSVTELRIHWPAGDATTIRNLPADVTIDLIEGASLATLCRGSHRESLVVLTTSHEE